MSVLSTVNKKKPSGCKLPGARLLSMINMMEKVSTRVNTLTPFTNFCTAKNLHGSAFSLHATRRTVKFLSCKQYYNLYENLHVPSKRVAEGKKFVRARGVYLVWTVQRTFWKGSEQEKQWGEGVRSESRKNSYNGSFQLLSTFEGLLPYGNAKWQRWDHQLEGLLSKKYFVRWLSWPLCGLKCPHHTLIHKQLVIKIIANHTASNI